MAWAGVLTKPDGIGSGDTSRRQMWKEIIEGRSKSPNHALKQGYYCVRLPSDEERARKPSRADFESLAAQFFDTKEPWKTIAERRRFGVPNFVRDVSTLLVKVIEN